MTFLKNICSKMTFSVFLNSIFYFFTFLKAQKRHFSFFCTLFLTIAFSNHCFAQIDTIGNSKENLIEDVLNNGDDRELDVLLLTDQLNGLRENPINLNKATAQQLNELTLLNSAQVQNFLQYRDLAGDLLNIYELQAIPGFDVPTIKAILPYIKLDGELDDNNLSLGEMWRKSNTQIMTRWERSLPAAYGYTNNKYSGSRDAQYFRFKRSYGNKLSIGITAEKDAGEPYLDKLHHIYGADFYSFHAFAKNVTHRIKAIALGDFAASFGQGLILYQDFAAAKSAYVMDVRRMQPTLRAFTSVNEINFMRGLGTTIEISKNIEATVFGSIRKRDATLGDEAVLPDDLPIEAGNSFFSNLQISGLHRTAAELTNRHKVTNTTIGANVVYQKNNKRLAFNALYNQFSQPIIRTNTNSLYTKYLFAGKSLLNLSADYAYTCRNIQAFGEIAYSNNNSIATMNSVLFTLDKRVSFSVVHRHFPRDFWVLQSNPYAESTTTNNENGLYTGIELTPTNFLKISAYTDFWSYPWLRSGADAPSQAKEYLIKTTFWKKRKVETYIQYRFKQKQTNNADYQLVATPRHQWRWHLNYTVSPSLDLRSRAEWNRTTTDKGTISKGFLVYQDVVLKSKVIPLSSTARIAYFDTDGFDSRIYTYENDLLNNYSAPAFANKGIRYYLNLRYNLGKHWSIEGRVAQTVYQNLDVIGSGNEAVQGNRKTEVKGQVRFSF